MQKKNSSNTYKKHLLNILKAGDENKLYSFLVETLSLPESKGNLVIRLMHLTDDRLHQSKKRNQRGSHHQIHTRVLPTTTRILT